MTLYLGPFFIFNLIQIIELVISLPFQDISDQYLLYDV